MNYEEDARIDPDALDVEWLKQAGLMREYCKHQAQTKKEVDEAKERLDVGKARIEMRIRSDPEAYGLAKITESAVSSTLLLQQEYQDLSQEYIDAKYENDIAVAVIRALEHKKSALENLVNLFGRSYFAGPRVPRNLSHEWLENQKRKENNTRVKIKRKNK